MTTSTRLHPGRRLRALTLALAVALALPLAAVGQDFSRYVAMGDSLTAGFSSGGLIDEVQVNSYPALLFNQVAPVTTQQAPGPFEQPLAGPPGIPPLLELVSLQPLIIAPRSANPGPPLNLTLPRPYNNMAVPGFKVRDVLQTVTGNPIIDLVLRGQGTQLQQALALQPTFVSLWIGNNDVLAAATSGIVIEGVTLTPVSQFEADYRAIVGAIQATGAEMALATIPNVTAIPFVTTLPPVVVNPATGQPVMVNGQLVPIIGPAGPLALTDRVLLTASTPLSQGFGIPPALGGNGQPLGTQYFLDGNELATITARVQAYNGVIRAVAQEAGAALLDINVIFDQVAAEGVDLGGIDYTADFLSGGVFSYDGVHPNTFGYAFVANELVKAINQRFGSNVPELNLYPFTFGPEAAAGTFTAAQAKTAIFSPRAYDSLRQALRVPKTAYLLRLLAGGPGGGGPGEPGAGPGNPGGPTEPPGPGTPERPDVPRPPRGGGHG